MLIKAAPLERVVAAIFGAAGSDRDEAACIARHLVDANLCGHDSHGVIRVPRYIAFAKAGTVRPGARPTVVTETHTALLVEGNLAYGQLVGEEAMARLSVKARHAGIALASVRNSGHLGRLGDWAEQLAANGLISLHFLSTVGLLAIPFGGTDRRLTLNPMAVCVPLAGRPPVLLDMTTTTVAEGKLAVARNKGERVPEGTIVDKDGRPTTDPNDFYAGGALLTIGGHKGHGLNIMTDILSGGLSGGGCTGPERTQLVNTMTSIAIDPGPLVDAEAFAAEVVRFAEWVRASPPARPGGEVLMPGDVEHRTRQERAARGIPLDATTWGQLAETAAGLGIGKAEVEALGREDS